MMADRYLPIEKRFWAKVEMTETCWLWTGTRNLSTGYGRFRMDGRQVGAHRVAYLLAKGPLDPDLTIDHLCSVKLCVRPQHLEQVTRGENVRRWAATVTACPQGHDYTPENTYTSARGRTCRTCERARMRADYWKKKATR